MSDDIQTSAGTRVFIGPTTAADDPTSYAALTYTEIEGVETVGEFGDSSTPVTFVALKDSRVRKLKGARDAGDVAIVCARLPRDPGQLAVKAAERTKFSYAIKVLLEDSADANDTDSVIYFHAKVFTARTGVGGNNDVTKLTINLGIDTEIVEDPSDSVP